jgi:hypothetical protein
VPKRKECVNVSKSCTMQSACSFLSIEIESHILLKFLSARDWHFLIIF